MAGCHVKPEQMFSLIFGYSDVVREKTAAVASGQETKTAVTGTVPANKIWVITHFAAYHNDAANPRTYVELVTEGTDHYLAQDPSLNQHQTLDRQGWWVLEHGEGLSATVINLADTKILYFRVQGFEMILAQ